MPLSSSDIVGSTVCLVLWRDAANCDFIVLAAYAFLADANAHVRRLGVEQLSDGLTNLQESDPDLRQTGAEPLRWDTADGLSCWVEQHQIKGKDESAQEEKPAEQS